MIFIIKVLHNISADISSGLLPVFFVVLRRLHGTSKHVLDLIHGVTCSDSVNHNQIQVIHVSCWTIKSDFLRFINLMFLHHYGFL